MNQFQRAPAAPPERVEALRRRAGRALMWRDVVVQAGPRRGRHRSTPLHPE